MAIKQTKAKKQVMVAKAQKTEAPAKAIVRNGDGGASTVVRATVGKADKTHKAIYDEAVKEIANLSQNEAAARKVDNGPLKEARGKDTWSLHAQLRALDHTTSRFEGLIGEAQDGIAATSLLVESHGSNISNRLAATRESVQGWITSTRGELNKAIKEAETAVTDALSKTQTAVNRNVKDGNTDVGTRLDALHQTVKDSFARLAKATAGSEENLRSQTESFSKATEALLTNLQNHVDRRIQDFRDEATRQVDKRFNQSDVAFAAVRADQEVIKALLTDIIKDRMGRAEPRVK